MSYGLTCLFMFICLTLFIYVCMNLSVYATYFQSSWRPKKKKKGGESQIPKRCDVGSPPVYVLLLLIKE